MDDAMPSIQASKCFVSFANLCVFAGAAQRESKLPSSLLGHGDGEGARRRRREAWTRDYQAAKSATRPALDQSAPQ